MKLWGGRFEAGPSKVFERFSGSLHFDKRLLDADIRGSIAYASALERVGILTASERDELAAALLGIRKDSEDASFWQNADDEDVHTLVIRKLKERAGTLADKIHTGRSRNDQVALDLRLWLREEIDRSVKELLALMSALLDMAKRDPQAIVVGYTHTRRAQPVLWPHYLLAYFEMFARDLERLKDTRSRVDVMPLGSGPQVAISWAAIDPPAAPVAEKAAPIESVGAADPHEPNWCKMMSRCPQQPDDDGVAQAELVVPPFAPPKPSEYIQ